MITRVAGLREISKVAIGAAKARRNAVDASRQTQNPTLPAEPESTADGAARSDEHASEGVVHSGVGQRMGRYLLLSQLGAGGMGVVYEAYDHQLDRKVAIKLLRTSVAHDDVEGSRGKASQAAVAAELASSRLIAEAQSLAQVQHPNIVSIFDVGRTQSQVYLAMELVVGVTLKHWMSERPQPWRQVVEVFARAADGLHAAHSAGVVHHDFKPDNVMLDGRLCPQILDFGLADGYGGRPVATAGGNHASARVLHTVRDSRDSPRPRRADSARELEASALATSASARRRDRAVAGTPAYMAPEQHLGHETDERCDQYAFCVSLFEALYGARPFAGSTAERLEWAKSTLSMSAPPRPRAGPRWLHDLIIIGLAVNPDQRHASMAAIAQQLRDGTVARGRQLALASIASVAVTLASVGQLSRSLALRSECSNAANRAALVWNSATKHAIEGRLVARNDIASEAAWAHAARGMDDHMKLWAEAARSACDSTYAQGTQSQTELNLRMECLDSKLAESRELMASWAAADTKILEQAPAMVAGLSTIDECEDPQSWLANAHLPRDPAARAQVLELESRLRDMDASASQGNLSDARELGTQIVVAAETLGAKGVAATAQIRLARIEADLIHPEAARARASEAMVLAEAGRDDRLSAMVAAEQIKRSSLGWSFVEYRMNSSLLECFDSNPRPPESKTTKTTVPGVTVGRCSADLLG